MKRKLSSCLLLILTTLMLFGFSDCKDTGNLEIEGVQGPKISLFGENLLISLVFENLLIEGGARIDVPKYPNSYVEIGPDLETDGTMMAVNVSLSDIFEGNVDTLDPQTLPGGRPLPGVAIGALPAVAFTVEAFNNMTFYLGPEVFGAFIPYDASMEGTMLSTRFYHEGKRVGNLTLVGNDINEENGGILLMLDLTFLQEQRGKNPTLTTEPIE